MKYLVVIMCFIAACNPVKRVLKDPLKFEEVAQEAVRRGYCVNDTTVIIETKDSVIYRDSIIERVEKVPCKDFDTTIGRARIKVSSGVLTYSAKDSIVYRTKTIKETVRDLKYESLLKSDIVNCQNQLKSSRDSVAAIRIEYKEYKADARYHQLKLWLLIIALVTFAFRKQILSLLRLVV